MVADEPRRSTVSAEIDAASWKTDDAKRDKDVRGKRFLDVERHPTIGFRSTHLVRSGEGWQIAGVLSVRGGSAEIVLDLTEMEPTADGYRFIATAKVDRVAAGVTGGRAIIAPPRRRNPHRPRHPMTAPPADPSAWPRALAAPLLRLS